MLRIAFCEDDARQREQGHALLGQYINARGISAKVQQFALAQELLDVLAEDKFDIYLLDIVMPGMNGIELGMEIRKTDKDGAIIYMSSASDFAIAGYQAKASAYLLKPVKKDELFAALDEVFEQAERRKSKTIMVKCHEGTLRLNTDDIIYAELRGRAICYHLRSGCLDSVTIGTSFKKAVEPLLNHSNFVLCGSSFIVNLHYVQMVERLGVRFIDGSQLNLPKSACVPLRSAWGDYWQAQEQQLWPSGR